MTEIKTYLPGETDPLRLIDLGDYVTGSALHRGYDATTIPDYFLLAAPVEHYYTEVFRPIRDE